MGNRTQVSNVGIWTEETLILLKVRGVITENLLLKYQKQAITSALNGEYALMLLPTYCLKKIADVPSVALYFQSGYFTGQE